ncbi:MAG: calcium/sodium antiporter [Pseudomonadota bacterium]
MLVSSLAVPILALVVGFITLVWSADRFLSGAAATANNFGVSKMLIGLTIVSLGTSAPEILVSLTAAIDGKPLLAVGNAIGSNITNIGLVLGITAILAPLPFSQAVLRSELPWLLGATLLALVLLFDLRLSALDGLLLLTALGLIMYRLVHSQLNPRDDFATDPSIQALEDELDDLPDLPTGKALVWLLVGLLVLVASAELLVWSATTIAHELNVDDMVIGLTIVAIGTSLPELAATVGSALKGDPDIAIGNVVGSNILNILAVLSVPGLVAATDITTLALWRDAGMMLAVTLMLALFAYAINSQPVITRFEGVVLVCAWVGYTLLLIEQVSRAARL